MKIRESVSLIIWIAAFQSIGFLLGMMTKDNLGPWYQELLKSSLNPPGFVFSIVWPILYVLLALLAGHYGAIGIIYRTNSFFHYLSFKSS